MFAKLLRFWKKKQNVRRNAPSSFHSWSFYTFCILGIKCLFCGFWVILNDHKCPLSIFSVCFFLDSVINLPHLSSSWASDWGISMVSGLLISTLLLLISIFLLIRHQKLFSSSSSRALFSELVFSLCCSRLKVPVSQELTCRLLVSFTKTCNVSFFLATKIEEFYSLTRILCERHFSFDWTQWCSRNLPIWNIVRLSNDKKSCSVNEETVFSW